MQGREGIIVIRIMIIVQVEAEAEAVVVAVVAVAVVVIEESEQLSGTGWLTVKAGDGESCVWVSSVRGSSSRGSREKGYFVQDRQEIDGRLEAQAGDPGLWPGSSSSQKLPSSQASFECLAPMTRSALRRDRRVEERREASGWPKQKTR